LITVRQLEQNLPARLALLLQNAAKAVKELANEMRRSYTQMRNDPAFEHLLRRKTFANALGASQTLGKGHCYLRHVPGAPAVLFLYGFGGKFLVDAWAMKQLLPACTIIYPLSGLDWLCRPTGGNLEYLDDLLKHLYQRVHLDLSNVWLASSMEVSPHLRSPACVQDTFPGVDQCCSTSNFQDPSFRAPSWAEDTHNPRQ